MSELFILCEEITEEDYDGNEELLRQVTGTLDGIPLQPCISFEMTVSEADAKQQFRDYLTELEYTWDTEL